MNLNYALTKKELISGQLDNKHNSSYWISVDIAFIYIGFPIGFLIAAMNHPEPSLTINISTIILQIIFWYITYKYIIKRIILKLILRKKFNNINEEEYLEYYWELNEQGISIYQNKNKISFQWSDILKVIDTKEYIHFYIPMKEKIFIPKKKVFNKELQDFYSLLKANISKDTFNTYKEARKFSNAFKKYTY